MWTDPSGEFIGCCKHVKVTFTYNPEDPDNPDARRGEGTPGDCNSITLDLIDYNILRGGTGGFEFGIGALEGGRERVFDLLMFEEAHFRISSLEAPYEQKEPETHRLLNLNTGIGTDNSAYVGSFSGLSNFNLENPGWSVANYHGDSRFLSIGGGKSKFIIAPSADITFFRSEDNKIFGVTMGIGYGMNVWPLPVSAEVDWNYASIFLPETHETHRPDEQKWPSGESARRLRSSFVNSGMVALSMLAFPVASNGLATIDYNAKQWEKLDTWIDTMR
jgi:hypothetical protein